MFEVIESDDTLKAQKLWYDHDCTEQDMKGSSPYFVSSKQANLSELIKFVFPEIIRKPILKISEESIKVN